jgi:hypothetical protein
MTKIDVPEGLDPVDLAALQAAFSQCYASSKKQAEQLDDMLRDRPWEDVAQFAAYSRQITTMKLRPWEQAPCHVEDENEPKRGEETAARVLKKMLKAGISRWHPNPLAALAESEEKAT